MKKPPHVSSKPEIDCEETTRDGDELTCKQHTLVGWEGIEHLAKSTTQKTLYLDLKEILIFHRSKPYGQINTPF